MVLRILAILGGRIMKIPNFGKIWISLGTGIVPGVEEFVKYTKNFMATLDGFSIKDTVMSM